MGRDVIGLAALGVAYITYTSQRNKVRLEYVVETVARLVPESVSSDIELRHGDEVVQDPFLVVVRLVNTGDRPIESADFETDLSLHLDGVDEIALASIIASRPVDLRPFLRIDDGAVHTAPSLINPGDMLVFQILCSGHPRGIRFAGRVSGVRSVNRRKLPYPPGSGAEGEMLGFDRLVWYFVMPAFVLSVAIGLPVISGVSDLARWLWAATGALIAIVLYPFFVRYLVRRRRLWRR